MVRLAKYLAEAGIASRRKAESLILDGKVQVNGCIVTTPGYKVEPEQDQVVVDNRPVQPEKRVYYVLNKPRGFLSTVIDVRGRPTVMQLMNGVDCRVYPVGRLDMDTYGLLLFTNDGDFANLMIHPRHHVPKTYQAWVKGHPDNIAMTKLREGIMLEDGWTAPAGARILQRSKDQSLVEMVLYEGRKRQVKRMLKAVGHPVVELCRTGFGCLNLDGIAPGQYRLLKDAEVNTLKKLAFGESLDL